MNGSLNTHGNATHWCPAFLDSHHTSAVSRETEPAEPLTVCEFQRPSATEDFMQPWQREQPSQRLADQEHPHMLLNLAVPTLTVFCLFSYKLNNASQVQ